MTFNIIDIQYRRHSMSRIIWSYPVEIDCQLSFDILTCIHNVIDIVKDDFNILMVTKEINEWYSEYAHMNTIKNVIKYNNGFNNRMINDNKRISLYYSYEKHNTIYIRLSKENVNLKSILSILQNFELYSGNNNIAKITMNADRVYFTCNTDNGSGTVNIRRDLFDFIEINDILRKNVPLPLTTTIYFIKKLINSKFLNQLIIIGYIEESRILNRYLDKILFRTCLDEGAETTYIDIRDVEITMRDKIVMYHNG